MVKELFRVCWYLIMSSKIPGLPPLLNVGSESDMIFENSMCQFPPPVLIDHLVESVLGLASWG